MLLPGTVVDDRYEILEVIGEGGSGQVYACHDLRLERKVALKFVNHSELSVETLARFQREGKILSRLSHSNILGIFRCGLTKDQRPFIAMEYVSGCDLRSSLAKNGVFSADRVMSIALQVCDALSHAHRESIIHRDLKPANIMLTDTESGVDFVKVVDFGMGRILEGGGQSTYTTTALQGSLHYMSPEQCSGKTVDSRSDIYSLGCVLYELLSGEPPFEADDAYAVINMHLKNPLKPIPASRTKGTVPAGLDWVLRKATNKDPACRYQSMEAFANDIKLVQSGEGTVLYADTGKNHFGNSSFRIGAIVVVSILAAIMAVFGAYIMRENLSKKFSVEKSNLIVRKRPYTMMELIPLTKGLAEQIKYSQDWLSKYGSSDDLYAADMHYQLASLYSSEGNSIAMEMAEKEALTKYLKIYHSPANSVSDSDRWHAYSQAIDLLWKQRLFFQVEKLHLEQLHLAQLKNGDFRSNKDLAILLGGLSESAFMQGKQKECLKWAKQALGILDSVQDTEVDGFRALLSVAGAEFATEDTVPAMKHLDRAISMAFNSPDNPKSLYYLELADKRFQEDVPFYAAAALRISEALEKFVRQAQARNKNLSLESKLPEIALHHAIALSRLGHFADSQPKLMALREPLAKDPDGLALCNNWLTRNALAQGSFADARRFLADGITACGDIVPPDRQIVFMAQITSSSGPEYLIPSTICQQIEMKLQRIPIEYQIREVGNLRIILWSMCRSTPSAAYVEILLKLAEELKKRKKIGQARLNEFLAADILILSTKRSEERARQLLRSSFDFGNDLEFGDRMYGMNWAIDSAIKLHDYSMALNLCKKAVELCDAEENSKLVAELREVILYDRLLSESLLGDLAAASRTAEEGVKLFNQFGLRDFKLAARFGIWSARYYCDLKKYDFALSKLNQIKRYEELDISMKLEILKLRHEMLRLTGKAEQALLLSREMVSLQSKAESSMPR